MPLAAGGMARIYIGRSTGIGSFERHVVLKLITPERANDQTAVQMFLDEARLAASLNHQNVAQVFEVGEDAGIHYLAMEYVHGQDLRALLAKAGSQGTRIPLDLALTTVAGAAAGLNHAHERRGADGVPLGIVHRDVSPSNIMIGYDGSVKLLDFGIAKATSRSVETQSGIIKGKFAYMAPEQCRGRDVDRRSDVFSLGIILYEISTQHRCFRADSDFDTMHRIVTGDVVRPTRLVQGYPPALEAIVMKALAVDATVRYQSAGHLLEAIEAFSIASRMSLSTMGLGRFMRDMFGEITEPWLGTAQQVAPIAAKESTISSTDGHSDVGPGPRLPTDEAKPPVSDGVPPDDDEARFPDSGGIAATLVMDPLRPRTTPSPKDWQSFGAGQPTERLRPTPVPTQPAAPAPVVAPLPAGVFPATPGSGSAPVLPSTRHGYASGGGAMTRPGTGTASDPGYPRYEQQVDDVELRPSRRVLYIGAGLLAIGVFVVIALAVGGNGKDDGLAARATTDSGSSAAAVDTVDDYIRIHLVSDPRGADVLIAGTKVGITPFDGKLRRGTKIAPLVVHMSGYEDFTWKLDLAGEYRNDKIKLDKLPEVAAPRPPAPDKPMPAPVPHAVDTIESGSADRPTTTTSTTDEKVVSHPMRLPARTPSQTPHPTAPRPTPSSTHVVAAPPPPPPPAPKCQSAGAVNPWDTSCDGKACPVCK
jgi:serine/threonine protein kinase